MKKIFEAQNLFITLGIFAAIIIFLLILILGVGKAYRLGLSRFSPEQAPGEVSLKKKKEIKKISISRGGESGCMEITPDGIVRIYSTCGENLTSADRLTDLKFIQNLFRLINEQDLSKYTKKLTGEDVIEITVNTDTGTEHYYLIIGDPGTQGIIDTIENIKGDLPGASPSPQASIGASGYIPPSPPPPGSSQYYIIPSATPGSTSLPITPFTCDFIVAPGMKKPFNISNIICSTQPSPVP